jgi:aryl-alcohol dehydrogenase-like predicted oxidoreductase
MHDSSTGNETSATRSETRRLVERLLAAQKDDGRGLPTRPLGKTGVEVSILALGGWHIGKASLESGEREAIRLMQAAIDAGLTFFDNAWDYHDGMAEELMGKALAGRRDKVFLMTKNCERDYAGSLACLDDSLRRLKTDRLDLWQFHEIVYDNDPDWVFEKGGLKAALEAQQAGKVRFIGFTGHKDPSIHLKMLGKPYAWATSQMPINVCDYHYRSFEQQVVPLCLQHGTAVLGMKSLGGSPDLQNARFVKAGVAAPEECLRYALSQGVSSLVVGIRNQRDLDQALAAGRGFKPMSQEEQAALRERVREQAGDGRHELFKSSKHFDGPHHRKQHGFAVEGV